MSNRLTDEYLRGDNSFLRLYEEYVKYRTLVVAFDFDNTVYDFHKKGERYEDVIGLLRDLRKIGCTLTCWTGNTDIAFVTQFLVANDIPFDRINENPEFYKSDATKVYANAYLDDRAGLLQVFNELSEIVSITKKIKQIK